MTAGLECPLRISCAAFASWWEHCDNKLEANTLSLSAYQLGVASMSSS